MLNLCLYKEVQILKNFNSKLSIRQIIQKFGPQGQQQMMIKMKRNELIKQKKSLVYESSDMILNHEYAAIISKFTFKRDGISSIRRKQEMVTQKRLEK